MYGQGQNHNKPSSVSVVQKQRAVRMAQDAFKNKNEMHRSMRDKEQTSDVESVDSACINNEEICNLEKEIRKSKKMLHR